jgi:DNA-binding MarR family transcriptional regulator/N-acetylglutamate synthase-like GNAT family acetyltransferase
MPQRVEAIRRFNRFYTRLIGLLEEGVLRSPFTLAEARVLYEIAHQDEATATDVAQALGLDAGYLSRILSGLQQRGMVEKTVSESDRRRQLLSLTADGRTVFTELNAASHDEIATLLTELSEPDQAQLVEAMAHIERLLGARPEQRVPYILRPHRSGDMGWVVQRHGVLYNREYGWGERFEGLVAEVVADFLLNFEPQRERCWIAEREGANVGSVFVVKHPERVGVAKLRLLLVEPSARGLGIGRRLVQECTRFARESGYHTLTLWTNSVLESARRIYQQEGYRKVAEHPHEEFGLGLIGETWELTL